MHRVDVYVAYPKGWHLCHTVIRGVHYFCGLMYYLLWQYRFCTVFGPFTLGRVISLLLLVPVLAMWLITESCKPQKACASVVLLSIQTPPGAIDA